MSLKPLTGFDTTSPEYVVWMASVWKANDLRNQFLKQLEVCEKLKLN
jgi:hypothetical protein